MTSEKAIAVPTLPHPKTVTFIDVLSGGKKLLPAGLLRTRELNRNRMGERSEEVGFLRNEIYRKFDSIGTEEWHFMQNATDFTALPCTTDNLLQLLPSYEFMPILEVGKNIGFAYIFVDLSSRAKRRIRP